MSPSTAWVLSLIVHLAPPVRMAAQPTFPGHDETAEQWAAREATIAEDIAATSPDPREQAVLVAVAFHESGFAHDVDMGPCYRGPSGNGPRCDGGLAVSIFQLHAAGDEDAAELRKDRRKAAARALSAIRRSARHCAPKYGAEGALKMFASGSCSRGAKESADMVRLARRLLSAKPPPNL